MKNFLWFVVGLLVAAGGVLAQNQTLTEQLLTNINNNVQAGVGLTGSAPPSAAIYDAGNGSGATGGLLRANVICDQHAFRDETTTGLKTVVAGVSGRKTYICGFMITTGGTATNLGLTSGTGTDCVTTSVAITPVYQLVANDKIGANSPFWNGLITLTNADNLCISASAGNQHSVDIWYAIL